MNTGEVKLFARSTTINSRASLDAGGSVCISSMAVLALDHNGSRACTFLSCLRTKPHPGLSWRSVTTTAA